MTCRSWSTCSRRENILGEEYYRAGGMPAVMNELLVAGRLHGTARTINGKTVAQNVDRAKSTNRGVIRPTTSP